MDPAAERRPSLAPSVSAPDVFCRPMEPAPAPLVYINGWRGIGKETVAEFLTLLLGKDKSMLVDVRSIGSDSDIESGNSKNRHPRRHHHQSHRPHRPRPLLTPEHPRYFSFDLSLDTDLDHSPIPLEPLPSTSFSQDLSSSFSRSGSISPTTSAASAASAASTASTTSTTSTASTVSSTVTTVSTTTTIPDHRPPPLSLSPTTITASTTTTTTTTTPYSPSLCTSTPTSPTTSATALANLLTQPPNTARIAVLAACAPDTPCGRATLQTLETAAARAGRLFVPVVLRCDEGEYLARRRRGERRQEQEQGQEQGKRGPGYGYGYAHAPTAVAMRRNGSLRARDGRGRAEDGGVRAAAITRRGSEPVVPSGGCFGVGFGGGESSREGEARDGDGAGLGLGLGLERLGLGSESVSVSGPGGSCGACILPAGAGGSAAIGGNSWPPSHPGEGDMAGLAMPMTTAGSLTVDVTNVPALDAALQIVEFVRRLVVERDAEWCSSAGRSEAAPLGVGVEDEKEWRAEGKGTGDISWARPLY